jgi:hypothetical protein
MDLTALREKHEAQGYTDGVLAERLVTINLLQNIADAPDVEAAVHAARERLVTLQAKEASARAQQRNGKPGTGATASAEATAERHINQALGASPVGEPDIGDLVADAVELRVFGRIRDQGATP